MTANPQHPNPHDPETPVTHAGELALIGRLLDEQGDQGKMLARIDQHLVTQGKRDDEDRKHFRQTLLDQAKQLGGHGERIGRVETSLGSVERRVAKVETSAEKLGESMQELRDDVGLVRGDVKKFGALLALIMLILQILAVFALSKIGGAA